MNENKYQYKIVLWAFLSCQQTGYNTKLLAKLSYSRIYRNHLRNDFLFLFGREHIINRIVYGENNCHENVSSMNCGVCLINIFTCCKLFFVSVFFFYWNCVNSSLWTLRADNIVVEWNAIEILGKVNDNHGCSQFGLLESFLPYYWCDTITIL